MPAKSQRSKLAYLAGLVDGEGSLTISYSARGQYPKRYGRATLTVYNTNTEVLSWVLSNFGGALHYTERKNKPNWKTQGRWCLSDEASVDLLKKLRPYLIIKREPARVLIAFQKTKMSAAAGRKRGAPHRLYQYRENLRLRLASLNKRGKEHAS